MWCAGPSGHLLLPHTVLHSPAIPPRPVCVDVTFNICFLVSTTAPSSAERPWCFTLTGPVIVLNEVEV